METVKKHLGLFIILAIFVAMSVILLTQVRTIQNLRQKSDEDKEAAIIEVENRYKDSIRLSIDRVKILQTKYDSVTASKAIIKEAIKINKKKSDEKIRHIYSANDSTLRFLSDSVLRANGK